MMTRAEILASYPECAVAVAWCETCLEPSTVDNEWIFAEIRRKGLTPAQVLNMLRETIEQVRIGSSDQARAQMDHPKFRDYIAAKLGMM